MGASRAQIMLEEPGLEIVLGSPDPRLRGCVRRYFGYFERSSGFSRTRELPSADVTLIIGFGPPIGVAYPPQQRRDVHPPHLVRRRAPQLLRHRRHAGLQTQYRVYPGFGPLSARLAMYLI